MSADVLVYLGVGLLLLAAASLAFLYLTADRVVPMSRRRPADALETGLIPRVAEAASTAAGYALGGRAGAVGDSLTAAGIRTRPQDFMVLVASGMVVGFAGGLVLGGGLLAAFLIPLLVPVGAALYVRYRIGARRRKFTEQLEETLTTLSGSLRAGFSLPHACMTIANELEEPTAGEFARVVNETRLGRSFIEALSDVAQRNQNEDFDWVVQAIAINREVGGNLADVLAGVGTTIRERVQLKRQVEALASEGKLSAVILGVLPIAVFLMLAVVNPGYIAQFGTPLGIAALMLAAVLLVAGLFWLSRVIKIKF